MTWEVEFTDEFGYWWDGLTERGARIGACQRYARGEFWTRSPYPHSSDVTTSRHGNMRELRIQHAGRPCRVLYAFDPRRCAILLIGGDKTGNDRWYDIFVPIADRLYDEHLKILREEGLINGS